MSNTGQAKGTPVPSHRAGIGAGDSESVIIPKEFGRVAEWMNKHIRSLHPGHPGAKGVIRKHYIVDATPGYGTHTTIQAAITAAIALGSGFEVVIYCNPGTYSEDLTVPFASTAGAIYLVGEGTVKNLDSGTYNSIVTVQGTTTTDPVMELSGTGSLSAIGIDFKPRLGSSGETIKMVTGNDLELNDCKVTSWTMGFTAVINLRCRNCVISTGERIIDSVGQAYFEHCYLSGVGFIKGNWGTLVLNDCILLGTAPANEYWIEEDVLVISSGLYVTKCISSAGGGGGFIKCGDQSAVSDDCIITDNKITLGGNEKGIYLVEMTGAVVTDNVIEGANNADGSTAIEIAASAACRGCVIAHNSIRTIQNGVVVGANGTDGTCVIGPNAYYDVGTDTSGVPAAEDYEVPGDHAHDGTPGGGGTVDADDITYVPDVDADWDGDTDPGNLDDALDQLAERATDLEEGVVALNEPTGFPNRDDSVLSISTRTFTIAPDNGSFDYYQVGVKYTVSSPDDIIISDVSGAHFIYYDGDTLSESVNPGADAFDTLMVDKVLVGLVYWNATDGAAYILGDERHGTNMSGRTHEWLHDAIGAVWSSGLTVSGYTEDEPDSDASLTLYLTDGEFYDQDIDHNIVDGTPANQYEQQLNGVADAEIPVLYRDATDGSWKEDAASTLPWKVGGTGRLAFNRDDGGSFGQVEVTDGKWVSATLIATSDWQYPIKMVQGQVEYTDKKTAIEEATNEIIAWGTLPTPEMVILYRFVLQTKDSYGSTPNAKIVDVTDFRRSGLTGGAATAQDHGTLSGLGDDDHGQYVLKSLFDANTILAANTDNTPAAVTIATQRIVGRLDGTIAGIRIGIIDNTMVQVDGPGAGAPANGEYAKWTASGLEGKTAAEVMGDLGFTASAEELETAVITVIIDGSGSAITTGVKADIWIPFACTAKAWRLLADQDGAIVIDVWNKADGGANYPPEDGEAMPGGGKEPTISASDDYAEDDDVTDWDSTSIAAGSTLRFNCDSCTTITRVTLCLKVQKV